MALNPSPAFPDHRACSAFHVVRTTLSAGSAASCSAPATSRTACANPFHNFKYIRMTSYHQSMVQPVSNASNAAVSSDTISSPPCCSTRSSRVAGSVAAIDASNRPYSSQHGYSETESDRCHRGLCTKRVQSHRRAGFDQWCWFG